jgi:dihydrofolate reductase
MSPTISLIAAIGKNRELGKDNKLLWNIPEDLKRFKDLTHSHPIIMGRKTYESIGRPLPNRINIIITRDPEYRQKVDGVVVVVDSLQAALDTAMEREVNEIFIIGGGQIFEEAIKIADKLYLTIVDKEYPNADVYFPDYSEFKTVVAKEDRALGELKYIYLDLVK